MNAYGILAARYDDLMSDVSYPEWADRIERHFHRHGRPVHTVLDLACGTGTLSCLLAQRGYEVIGADSSAEMLAVAAEKAGRTCPPGNPIFLCQSMEELDLYGTVDACLCCLDSVNHLPGPKALRRMLRRVRLFLEPGGIFLFDINTPERLRSLDGQVFLDEREDLYCVWRASWSERRQTCFFGLDLFRRTGALWERGAGEWEEYAFKPAELEAELKQAGFKNVRQFGEGKLRPPRPSDGRILFRAEKPDIDSEG